jgi:hypothetical protein
MVDVDSPDFSAIDARDHRVALRGVCSRRSHHHLLDPVQADRQRPTRSLSISLDRARPQKPSQDSQMHNSRINQYWVGAPHRQPQYDPTVACGQWPPPTPVLRRPGPRWLPLVDARSSTGRPDA